MWAAASAPGIGSEPPSVPSNERGLLVGGRGFDFARDFAGQLGHGGEILDSQSGRCAADFDIDFVDVFQRYFVKSHGDGQRDFDQPLSRILCDPLVRRDVAAFDGAGDVEFDVWIGESGERRGNAVHNDTAQVEGQRCKIPGLSPRLSGSRPMVSSRNEAEMMRRACCHPSVFRQGDNDRVQLLARLHRAVIGNRSVGRCRARFYARVAREFAEEGKR